MASVKSRIPRVQATAKGPGGRLGNLNPMFQRQTADLEAQQLSPLVIKQARRSGRLSLSGKNLTSVPEKVWKLESLDEAEIKSIDIRIDDSSSPESKWWEHEPLTTLDLSNNSLVTLSPKIQFLSSLTNLMLHNNSLTSLPKEIGQLTKLTKLNLSHNKLESLPEGIFKLTELRQLNISHNVIQEISESIADLNMLEKLDMSHNRLTVLPPDVGYLTHLTQLSALHNAITDVPPDVGNLRVLHELDLSHNSIPVLPPLGELKKLEIFRAEHNNISEFPDVRGCPLLRELHLSGNSISEIPGEMLEDLTSIRVLGLRDNELEGLPEEITQLNNLIRLDIGNNGIKEVPPSLALLPHLSTLTLDGNPLRSVRSDIIRAGTTRVLKVLRGQLSDDSRPSMSPNNNGLPGLKDQPWPNKYNMKAARSLNLALRELTEVPEDVFNEAVQAEVSTVDICKNMLTAVPQGLTLLAEFLTELNLSNNKLTSLPESLVSCKRLHYIEVSQNCLSDLPPIFDKLEQLREINLSYNRFEAIPSCLHGMPGLEILLARDNKIKEIDAAGLGSIPRLATLDLANNDIGSVPPQLGLLRLHCLELNGNPFKIPRQNILEKGTPSIMAYLRDRLPR